MACLNSIAWPNHHSPNIPIRPPKKKASPMAQKMSTLHWPKKVLTILHKEVKNELVRINKGLNNWGIVYSSKAGKKHDDRIYYNSCSACYARLRYKEHDHYIDYFVDWCFAKDDRQELQPFEMDYLHWLANESVFSSLFITKDPHEIFTIGTIFNTNAPAQVLISAAISVRYVFEYRHIPFAFQYFREHMSGEAALIFSHMIWKVEDGKSMKFRQDWGDNHTWASSGRFGIEALKNFVAKNTNYMDKLPLFTKNTDYGDLTCPWYDDPTDKGVKYGAVFHQCSANPLKLPPLPSIEVEGSFGPITMKNCFAIEDMKDVCAELLEINNV